MPLYSADRLIEAERLAATLVTVSRQVNGPEHNTTIDLKKILGGIQMHVFVFILKTESFRFAI